MTTTTYPDNAPISFRGSIELRLALREAALKEAKRLNKPDYRASDLIRDAVREKLAQVFGQAA